MRRQHLSNSLPPKFFSLTKDVPNSSEYLLSNDLNERLDGIKISQQMLQFHSPYRKNSEN